MANCCRTCVVDGSFLSGSGFDAVLLQKPFATVVPDLPAHDEAILDLEAVNVSVVIEFCSIGPCAKERAKTVDNHAAISV